jgi:hypothetical protein
MFAGLVNHPQQERCTLDSVIVHFRPQGRAMRHLGVLQARERTPTQR